MKWSRLFVFACVVAQSMSPAIAQTPIRLQCEVTLNGSIVAKPELRVTSGFDGEIQLGDPTGSMWGFKGLREKVVLTPVVRDDDIAITFNIATADRPLRPSLVISTGVRGSLEWTSTAGVPIRLTVSWVQ